MGDRALRFSKRVSKSETRSGLMSTDISDYIQGIYGVSNMKNETKKKTSALECPLCRVSFTDIDDHLDHEHGMKREELADFLRYVDISRENQLKKQVFKGLCMTFWIYALVAMWVALLFITTFSGFTLGLNTGIMSVSSLSVGSMLILRSEVTDE